MPLIFDKVDDFIGTIIDYGSLIVILGITYVICLMISIVYNLENIIRNERKERNKLRLVSNQANLSKIE